MSVTKSKVSRFLGIAASTALLASCNIFNPTGDGDAPSSTGSYQQEAYKLYRKAKYDEALKYFDKAIKNDSTNSEAYLGAAKAKLAMNKVNAFTILKHVKEFGELVPFMDLSGRELERYDEGISGAMVYIDELRRRDSITVNEGESLSDRKLRYESVAAGHSLLRIAAPLVRFRASTAEWGDVLKKDDKGDLAIALGTVYENAVKDISAATSFNGSLKDLSNNFTNIVDDVVDNLSKSLNLSKFTDDDEEEKTPAEIVTIVKENTGTLKDQVLFYAIGDKMDNDGDGCVDEEIQDNRDNDGDGLIDEDVRVTDVTRQGYNEDSTGYNIVFTVAPDGIDHDMDGIIDGEAELNYAIPAEERAEKKNYKLLFAAAKDYEVSSDKAQRIKVMNDIDPDNIQYDLEWRKKYVGGCWVNYTEEMFKAWFKGRK